LGLVLSVSAATNNPPDFKELFSLVRDNLKGMSEADLNRAAVEGLLNSLRGKVVLLSDESKSGTNSPLVNKSAVLGDNIAWIRVGRVAEGLDKVIENELSQVASTNRLKGLALDLRFAEGDDYAAAASTADLFQVRDLPLLDWGEGVIKSTKKYDAIKIPVVVLVNHDTVGAAEALAAVMRETGTALILGGPTAGAAMIGKEFTLKGGQRVRVASAPVKVGEGTPLTLQGVKPDIEVLTSADEERVFLEDPYASAKTNTTVGSTLTATNSPSNTNRVARRPRPNEADLVRARRDGLPIDGDLASSRAAEPEKPLIRDPALARAFDLLKGLAVVRPARN
jgi:C-terminal processing protease CtpA/Prc